MNFGTFNLFQSFNQHKKYKSYIENTRGECKLYSKSIEKTENRDGSGQRPVTNMRFPHKYDFHQKGQIASFIQLIHIATTQLRNFIIRITQVMSIP